MAEHKTGDRQLSAGRANCHRHHCHRHHCHRHRCIADKHMPTDLAGRLKGGQKLALG